MSEPRAQALEPYSEAELDAALETYERHMGRITESRDPDDVRVLAVGEVHARLVATARAGFKDAKRYRRLVVTGKDADVIRDEIENGTPDTPERIENIRRADETYARYARSKNASRAEFEGDSDTTFVIWSRDHNAWWGVNHRGYFVSLFDAGLWTQSEAEHLAALWTTPLSQSVAMSWRKACEWVASGRPGEDK